MKSKWTLKQIQEWTQGQIISTHQSEFNSVCTDTRVKMAGDIFIALRGDNFDAHHFLSQAIQQGAGLLIVDKETEDLKEMSEKVSVLYVKDTLKALQNFAHHYRKNLNCKVIGITGSNGKTTTKEFTAAILNTFKSTYFNKGSFNNHWGVPLTLLQVEKEHQFAILEMGMNHAGELTELVQIADPDIVCCTMVGHAHIEFFGTQKKIAEAKSEIYMSSREDTVRIFNQDQDLTFDMMYPVAKKFPASRMLSFSELNKDADVYFKIEEDSVKGLKLTGNIASVWGGCHVSVFGRHNITNLMAAANIAYVCGMTPEQIWQALPECKSTWGRNQFIETEIGAQILFDGYNANPDSMLALIKNISLLQVEGKKIGVFGQMKELGDQSFQLHKELAEEISKSDYHFIYFVGESHEAFESGLSSQLKENSYIAKELTEDLKKHFTTFVNKNDLVSIKGSRGAKTEKFVELLKPINWSAQY